MNLTILVFLEIGKSDSYREFQLVFPLPGTAVEVNKSRKNAVNETLHKYRVLRDAGRNVIART